MMSPTVIRGFSEVYGSWKIIWMSRRMAFRLRPSGLGEVAAEDLDRPGRRRLEPDHQAGQCRLAATGFADDTEGLAAPDRQVDAVDGLDRTDLAADDDAAPQRVVLDQALDLEDGLAETVLAQRSAPQLAGLPPAYTSWAKWQALMCPAATSTSAGGGSLRQMSCARGQRGE